MYFRKIKTFLHRMKIKIDKSVVRSRWEEDYELIENEGLFEEYLEMGWYTFVLFSPSLPP